MRLGWIIAHSETLNVQISGVGVGAYMDMGKPWVRSGALELFSLFRDIWKLGEVVLRVWKPRFCAMEKLRGRFGDMKIWSGHFERVETSALCYGETSGSFRGYGNLKGLFECVKTSVCRSL